MHPIMRTMFLALAVGSIGLFSSMLYFIGIAEATRPILYPDPIPASLAEETLTDEGMFRDLINDLRKQEGLPVDVLPIPPREYLLRRAEERGYDAELLNRIVFCESRWRMVENAKSTASGYFQILDGTEKLTPQYKAGLRKADPYVNIDMAIYLYGKYGTIPWTESRACWGR